MKKKISVFLILIFILVIPSSYSYAKPKKTKITKASNSFSLKCHAGVVIDQDSGRILYSRNGNMILPMASTTKIISAIVAIEKGNLKDIVTISSKSAAISGSTVGYKTGEKIKLEELLYGLMLKSGNDAAIAIAEHISGSVEKFAEAMNEKAIELGAYNTNFITPHGLDAADHYTTAEDLAKITAYAMRNSVFSKIASTKIVNEGVSGKFTRAYSNINKFLYKFDSADGVKTGFTGRAGKCLVASVKHNNGRFISVVFNSTDRWSDAAKMIQLANDKYKYIKVCSKGTLKNKLRVYGGNIKYVNGLIDEDLYIPVLKNDSENVEIQTFMPSTLFSPIYKNEVIGNLVLFINDKIIAKYPIRCNLDVKRKGSVNIKTSSLNSII